MGVGIGDIVDLTGLAGGTIGNGGTLNGSDQLVISNGTQSAILQLDTSGTYTGVTWQTSADGGTGTDVAAIRTRTATHGPTASSRCPRGFSRA